MSDLAAYLRANQNELIEKATYALARGEGLRAVVESEMARFFDLLTSAVETGSAEWLEGLLKDWVDARSEPAGRERQSVVPVFLALKNVTWEAIAEALPGETTLAALATLEPIFQGALQRLFILETESVVAEIQRQMAAAQAELEKLDRSKSSFISVAAHELKTPLTLIEGYTKMIASELPPDVTAQMRPLLGGVSNGTRRLREIVDDMVDVSLIDNEMLALSLQPVWLRRLFDVVQADLAEVLPERQLQLVVKPFEDGGQPTLADPERLYQVFRNVVLNAVKFTPDGGRITVTARPLPGFVEVSVSDTGIGVAPENQQRIFDKFGGQGNASLHSSGKTKFKGGGAGLGLAIARGIIEAHGGAIWCESPGYDEEKCPGATFHIMVPMRSQLPKDALSRLYGLSQDEIDLISAVRKKE
jgi:signal transduction histidine kinase